MNLAKKDLAATCLVAAAGVLFVLWVTGSPVLGMSTRAAGAVILALGFAASAIAVVPNFAQLLHGNKVYLTVACLIGLLAAIGGVLVLITESSAGVAVVMTTMVVLWLIATVHHSLLAKARTTVGSPGPPAG
ncbi:MAG: hypothetical protein WCG47_19935 [Dermatophilaceae bacterium]